MFNAVLLEKSDAGFRASIRPVDEAGLSPGDVRVRVDHSTLNYRDSLAITNRSPVVRAWPMVAGVDGAGTVFESSHPDWQPGNRFGNNGWGVGETRRGCLAALDGEVMTDATRIGAMTLSGLWLRRIEPR